MDYLDPKKQKWHHRMLLIGYTTIAIGVAIGSMVLLWQAYGYSVKNGKVIQSGMIFMSSQPNPAQIYINGRLNPSTTNTRLTIQSGTYSFELKDAGYRPWSHNIALLGGMVVHYDYPLLFPISLKPKTLDSYPTAPQIASQSPSQQFLVVSSPTAADSFLLYNLSSPATPAVSLSLPANVVTPATSTSTWTTVGWADDNTHLLLEHSFDGSNEFIELDTSDPTQSININKTFDINPTSVTLDNDKYNQFYIYSSVDQSLSTATIGSPTITPVLSGVLSYKTYLSDTVLYATSQGAPTGQVAVDMNVKGTNYFLKDIPLASTYLLNEASYSGNDYVVVGDNADNYVYIYENPLNQISGTNSKITPFLAIGITSPNYESFAPTAQFIMVENGTNFALYDIYNDVLYHYSESFPLDAPQTHAEWMDGDRLLYVSGGKISEADYDNTNHQILTASLPQYEVFFAPNYHSYFTLSASANATVLQQTSLLVP